MVILKIFNKKNRKFCFLIINKRTLYSLQKNKSKKKLAHSNLANPQMKNYQKNEMIFFHQNDF